MARKRTPEPPQPEPELRMPRDEAAAKIDDRIAKAQELLAQTRGPKTAAQIEVLKNEFHQQDAYNHDLLRQIFTTPKLAEEYSFWGIAVIGTGDESLAEKLRDLGKEISDKIQRLESIKKRLELSSRGSRLGGKRRNTAPSYEPCLRCPRP